MLACRHYRSIEFAESWHMSNPLLTFIGRLGPPSVKNGGDCNDVFAGIELRGVRDRLKSKETNQRYVDGQIWISKIEAP